MRSIVVDKKRMGLTASPGTRVVDNGMRVEVLSPIIFYPPAGMREEVLSPCRFHEDARGGCPRGLLPRACARRFRPWEGWWGGPDINNLTLVRSTPVWIIVNIQFTGLTLHLLKYVVFDMFGLFLLTLFNILII